MGALHKSTSRGHGHEDGAIRSRIGRLARVGLRGPDSTMTPPSMGGTSGGSSSAAQGERPAPPAARRARVERRRVRANRRVARAARRGGGAAPRQGRAARRRGERRDGRRLGIGRDDGNGRAWWGERRGRKWYAAVRQAAGAREGRERRWRGSAGTGGTTGTGGTGGSTPTIVGATPPMGWNSWNKFACNGLNETVVKAHGGRLHHERHEGRRLPVRQPRRLLDGRARSSTASSR